MQESPAFFAPTILFKKYEPRKIFRNERTRLYRIAIALNYNELNFDFKIFGVLKGASTFINVPFQKGVDYYGFLIERKKS